MTKRARVDQVEGARKAFEAAAAPAIDPPKRAKLAAKHRDLWRAIIEARARDEWSDVDLMHAAELVWCLVAAADLRRDLTREGFVVDGKANPKAGELDQLTRRTMALTKMLHLHASALHGDPRDLVPRREAEQAAREAGQQADDGLLATPMH